MKIDVTVQLTRCTTIEVQVPDGFDCENPDTKLLERLIDAELPKHSGDFAIIDIEKL